MPRIFICYRHEDSFAYAGRIYDRLTSQFGAANVFMDVDTLKPGVDFVEVLEQAVASCDVLIAVIGKQWVTSADEQGNPRLENPDDFVRLEIGTALERNIRVVPVLVGGSRMPRSNELPAALSRLARRHALEVPDTAFHRELNRLVESIEEAELQRKAEQDRLAREKAEAAQRAERELLAREKAEAAQRAERERLSREQAEAAQRTEQERLDRKDADRKRRKLAKPITGIVSPAPRAGDTRIHPKDGLTYVWIPPGSFTMGCSPGDTECSDDEKPAHAEQIATGFWLSQTEVTQAAWKRVMNNNPSHFKGDQLPVESVDWNQASVYCQSIGGRLPTEKEWEYAARAGATGPRYGALDAIAWYSDNSGGKTHPVGLKPANAYGLYDMLGNVWEWTSGYSYGTRVLRGGAWENSPEVVRVSVRLRVEPANRNNGIGFRCVGEFG
jgi:formylglycine-generating enzyme required for sulfatase activity